MKRTLLLLVSILSVGLDARAVSSHTLSAPSSVYANEDGQFYYQFTYVFTANNPNWWGIGFTPESNVANGVFDDCNCCANDAGTTFVYDVWGGLINPQEPGTVENWIGFCPDSTLSTMTTVLPYNLTESVPATWGRIKALYGR